MCDLDGEAAANGFIDREVKVAVCLLQDIHSFDEMVEPGVLGQEGGLRVGQDREESGQEQGYRYEREAPHCQP
jgi:hypothetical protein